MQKSAQYQSGGYLGVHEEGSLYKGFVAFIKQSISFFVQAIPKVTFKEQAPANKFSDNINNLIEIGLCVRGIVIDNHLSNVNEFSVLIKITRQCVVVTKGHTHILKQTCSF